jgi:hypothetical protein
LYGVCQLKAFLDLKRTLRFSVYIAPIAMCIKETKMKTTYVIMFKIVRWAVTGVFLLIVALPALTSYSA